MEISTIHEIMLAALIRLDDFCKAHGIRYVLAAGSQLGAIRHHGFIPWDDDVDIYMLPEDFKKFRDIFPAEVSKWFKLSNKKNERDYYLSYDKIRILGTRADDPMYKDFDVDHSMSIDVFPLYDVDGDNDGQQLKLLRGYMKVCQLVQLSCDYWQKSNTGKLGRLVTIIFGRGRVNGYALKLQQRLLNHGKSKYVTDPMRKDIYFERQWFEHPKYVDFEQTKMPVANDQQRCLEMWYGNWQQIPKESERINHDFLDYHIDDKGLVDQLIHGVIK